jgi:hypothetical protein
VRVDLPDVELLGVFQGKLSDASRVFEALCSGVPHGHRLNELSLLTHDAVILLAAIGVYD